MKPPNRVYSFWTMFEYPIRRLVKYRRREICIQFFFRSIRYRCACQISKRCDSLYCQSRGFETSRDLTMRRLIGYWNEALDSVVDKRKCSYRSNNNNIMRTDSDITKIRNRSQINWHLFPALLWVYVWSDWDFEAKEHSSGAIYLFTHAWVLQKRQVQSVSIIFICQATVNPSSDRRLYIRGTNLFITQWAGAHDAMITSLWCQNDVATSFWRHNDVVIASCVRWGTALCCAMPPAGKMMTTKLLMLSTIFLSLSLIPTTCFWSDDVIQIVQSRGTWSIDVAV